MLDSPKIYQRNAFCLEYLKWHVMEGYHWAHITLKMNENEFCYIVKKFVKS